MRGRSRSAAVLTGLGLAAMALVASATAEAAGSATIRMAELPLNGDVAPSSRSGLDINDRGQITGMTESAAQRGQFRVVRWDPAPGGHRVRALSPYQEGYRTSINERGDVLGRNGADLVIWDRNGQVAATVAPVPDVKAEWLLSFNDRRQVMWADGIAQLSGLPTRAVRWSPGGRIDTSHPPEHTGTVIPERLNNRGIAAGSLWGAQSTGFVWDGRTVTAVLGPGGSEVSSLVGFNDRGQSVGVMEAQGRMFVHHRGRSVDLGDLGGGWAWSHPIAAHAAINGKGQIVGVSATASGEVHPFLWDKGKMTDLGTLGGPAANWGDVFATAVNDLGQVLGTSKTPDGESHPFVWDRGRIHDLHVPGSISTTATDINDRGQIVGTVTTQSGTRPVIWTIERS
ncbi:hypothetical protein [Actinomadura rudentiformis]|uniref:HAF repeat-containing protein n=1 Tax=Actinomadura rudentiformis TaxID=359158 RepID=A0A6H9YNV2_9ACTN|nr:hypothetical protein [Actinomadura rudentiformis]KAB2345157.1 hypothetical protein F8566_28200 [Actinomadura rudentiformis]